MKACNYPTQAELLDAFIYVDGQLIRKSTNKRASHVHKGTGRNVTKYKSRNLYTARLIWTLVNGDLTSDQYIDHANQDPLDDRVENLRAVSKADNCRNVWKRNNTTGYRGVHWKADHNAWYATSTDKDGNKIFLGYHPSKEIAAEAVSSFLHKEFPHLF